MWLVRWVTVKINLLRAIIYFNEFAVAVYRVDNIISTCVNYCAEHGERGEWMFVLNIPALVQPESGILNCSASNDSWSRWNPVPPWGHWWIPVSFVSSLRSPFETPFSNSIPILISMSARVWSCTCRWPSSTIHRKHLSLQTLFGRKTWSNRHIFYVYFFIWIFQIKHISKVSFPRFFFGNCVF